MLRTNVLGIFMEWILHLRLVGMFAYLTDPYVVAALVNTQDLLACYHSMKLVKPGVNWSSRKPLQCRQDAIQETVSKQSWTFCIVVDVLLFT